jgi:hypothetical protein
LTTPSPYGIISTTKQRRIKAMMINVAISEKWFNEIKNEVPHGEPFRYTCSIYNHPAVEVDVDEEAFEKVSKEKGWM